MKKREKRRVKVGEAFAVRLDFPTVTEWADRYGDTTPSPRARLLFASRSVARKEWRRCREAWEVVKVEDDGPGDVPCVRLVRVTFWRVER